MTSKIETNLDIGEEREESNMSDEEMTSKIIEEYDLQGEETTVYCYVPHSFFLLSSTSSSSFSHILSSMSLSSLLNVLIFFP